MREELGSTFRVAAEKCSKSRAYPLRKSRTADHILKPRIASQRIEPGIHPDPRYSSGSLQESLLERIESFLLFAKLRIRSRNKETADVSFFSHIQSPA